MPSPATGRSRRFTLAGIAKFGEPDSLGGAAVAIVRAGGRSSWSLGLHGEFTTIHVAAAPGVDARAARAPRCARAAGQNVTRPHRRSSRRADRRSDVKDGLQLPAHVLLVFAGISLFVGAFLIFNTFSITVAQRVREFALLRMIGASRRQVLRAVIGEALLLGLIASTIGFLAGFGLAPALNGLFKLFGADLPSGGIVLEARTVIVSILVGTLVTLVAALGPALRATRVPPIAALQDAASLPRGRAARLRTPLAPRSAARHRRWSASACSAAGSGGDAAAFARRRRRGRLHRRRRCWPPRRRPARARSSGWPLERLRGVSGRLARENAMRNPRRTASTAAALMIGVALVAFVTIFAAGLKASIADAVGVGLKGQMIVESTVFGQALPVSATQTVAGASPGVKTVSRHPLQQGAASPAPASRPSPASTRRRSASVFKLDWDEGSPATLRDLGPATSSCPKDWAKDHGVERREHDRAARRRPARS